MISPPELLAGRIAIGLVWLYQGMFCKVLKREPRHGRVVGAVPIFNEKGGRLFLLILGVFETLLAVWAFSGRHSSFVALVQVGLLIVMNTGGLLWASKIIPDPAGMVFQNLAFSTLIWICR